MKKSKFTESQIIKILKEAQAGAKVADLAREYGDVPPVNESANYETIRPHSALRGISPREYIEAGGHGPRRASSNTTGIEPVTKAEDPRKART